VVAQAAYAATGLGLPAIAPAIRHHFGLTLTLAALSPLAGYSLLSPLAERRP